MNHWAPDAVFYHVYPLGLCGAPRRNDLSAPPQPRLDQLHGWIAHLRALGATAIYLGPLFESSAHGYDTADYHRLDRRLGNNETLQMLVAALHDNGIRVVLDGVFHHVGRDFWAFRDLQARGEASPYRDWFVDVDFSRRSPYNDPFAYAGWSGHYDLVKLNLGNPDVRAHLLGAVNMWIEEFGIDGLRLDVADALEPAFVRELAAFCRGVRPDFWLLGEVIHGDYRAWANSDMLDATTNYECYKGLFSSHNDRNYFEIAYSLQRQFGANGIYQHLPLYAFADNHDVPRIASTLHDSAHLYPLHALLFTIPGVPSIYYGSEWGIAGSKIGNDDWAMRPAIPSPAADGWPHPDLAAAIACFAQVRHQTAALRRGNYTQLAVAAQHLAFARATNDEYVVVAVNSANTPATLDVPVAATEGQAFADLLDPAQRFVAHNGRLVIDAVPACWARILKRLDGGAHAE